MKKFFSELFQDETNSFSSKRFIGILAGLTLCVTLFANSFYDENIKPADTLVEAVALLSFGCLGLASVDKIWAKRPVNNDKPKDVVSDIVDDVKEE